VIYRYTTLTLSAYRIIIINTMHFNYVDLLIIPPTDNHVNSDPDIFYIQQVLECFSIEFTSEVKM